MIDPSGPITNPITTPQQGAAAGAFDAANGAGAYARQTAAPTTPATTPATQPQTGDSTQTPNLRYTGGGNSSNTPASVAPADDAQLRATELANVQGSVDLANSNYTANLAATNTNNANIIGGARAQDARTGTLGSDFGAAHEQGASDKAAAATAKVQNAHNADIQKIYDSVNKDIAAKQTAYESQQNKLTDTQNANLRTNAFDAVNGLAAKGTSLDSLTQTEYNHIIESTGMTDDQLHAYYAGKVPADKINKEQIIGNNLVQVTTDPTGKTSVNSLPLGINVPTTYTTTHLPSGQIAFIPKGTAPSGILYTSKMDPSVDPGGKMIIYDGPGSSKPGKAAASAKTPAGAPTGVTQADISDGEAKLSGAKGADGHVDPYQYKAMYDYWTAKGGSSTAFTKAYPPKSYINPTDSSLLPTYLRPPATKAAAGRTL